MVNVLVFAVGQAFAWLFLRSGRFWLGAGATVALWTFIDWWLVARFVLGDPVEGLQWPLLGLRIGSRRGTNVRLFGEITTVGPSSTLRSS